MRIALTVLAAALALLGPATGANGSAPRSHVPLGLVPHAGSHAARPLRSLASSSPSDVVFHGGSVMHTNTTYAIYWVPSGYSVSAGYESLINRYFADVAAASGSSSNVYSVATQYYDNAGAVQYQSTFGGSYIATNALPANGCSAASVCLTDAQLETEIQGAVAANHWPEGTSSMFFLMTPSGVASCTDGTNTECSTNVYCAYHSAFDDTSTHDVVIYANEPYDAGIRGCAGGNSPNGDAADATINTISHESNEAITDPFGDGWWANDGNYDEIGDLCAWNFGNPLGGTPGVNAYNQVINGHDYWLQQEYSNTGSTCLQGSAAPAPANIGVPVVAGTAAEGAQLTSTAGTWSGSPTSYAYQWERCSTLSGACVDISGANSSTYTPTSADAGSTLLSTVSAQNAAGSSAYVASLASEPVVPLPATTRPPAVSGVAHVGKTLSTTDGTWNTPSAFAYAWLRCAADGSGCTRIPGATDATYVVASGDSGHALEARVTATNEAGSTTVTSAPMTVIASTSAKLHAPRIAGKAQAGRRLEALARVLSGAGASFRYQWLRCNAQGVHCQTIRHATRATYVLHGADVGHRVRVRVSSASANAASRTTALSAPTARVRR